MIAQDIKPNDHKLNVVLSAGKLFISILLAYGYLYYIDIFIAPRYPSWAVNILMYPLIIATVGGSIVLVLGLAFFTIFNLFKR